MLCGALEKGQVIIELNCKEFNGKLLQSQIVRSEMKWDLLKFSWSFYEIDTKVRKYVALMEIPTKFRVGLDMMH